MKKITVSDLVDYLGQFDGNTPVVLTAEELLKKGRGYRNAVILAFAFAQFERQEEREEG